MENKPVKIKAVAYFTITNNSTGKKKKGKTPVRIEVNWKTGSVRTVYKNPITLGNNETLELFVTQASTK